MYRLWEIQIAIRELRDQRVDDTDEYDSDDDDDDGGDFAENHRKQEEGLFFHKVHKLSLSELSDIDNVATFFVDDRIWARMIGTSSLV